MLPDNVQGNRACPARLRRHKKKTRYVWGHLTASSICCETIRVDAIQGEVAELYLALRPWVTLFSGTCSWRSVRVVSAASCDAPYLQSHCVTHPVHRQSVRWTAPHPTIAAACPSALQSKNSWSQPFCPLLPKSPAGTPKGRCHIGAGSHINLDLVISLSNTKLNSLLVTLQQ